jgi:hypothetical protein
MTYTSEDGIDAGDGARLLRIEDVPTEPWVGMLTERDLFLQPAWMRVGHGTYGGGLVDARVALVERHGTVVAGTVAWLFDQDCTEDFCRPDVLMEIDPALGAPLFPTVLAGGWYDSRIVHRPGEGLPGDAEAVLRAFEEWGRANGAASICWPSVDDREKDLALLLQSSGYVRFPLTPRWALEGPWIDLDDYANRLRRKGRAAVRIERRKVREAGITCRTIPLTRELARPLVELAEKNVERHGGTVDIDAYVEWVAALADIPGSEAHLAERDGRVLGCIVSSTFAGRVYALFPGFDYDQIEGLPLYFALCYYHMVEHAVANGLHAVEYGPAADDAKRFRGCVAYEQGLWIRGLNRDSAALLAELGQRAERATEPAVELGQRAEPAAGRDR